MTKGYALGGEVDDSDTDDTNMPADDGKPALDLDANDDAGGKAGGDPYNNALNTVSDVLNFGRQKYGIGQQVAGNMPAAPAGPGGEGRGQQPFQPAPGGTPFGKRNGTGSMSFDEGGAVGPQDDEQGAYNPEGDDPVGAVLSNALDSAGSATSAPMSPMEAGQGDAEMGALQQAGGALQDATADRPSADNPLSPSALRTALDPTTFHQNASNIANAAQPYMAKIISYLKGSDAAPPQAAQQAEGMVDPQGQMDPGMRKLLAIDAINKQYGPQAAWSMMQHYRQKYDAYKSFAAAANEGAQGKPRDPAAAAMAMQQAYDHLPDGQNLVVKPSGNGFTATVTGPNGKAQTVSLTPQQFNMLAKGPHGQFDNVIEHGLPNVLTKFVQRNGLTADQVQPDTSTSAPAGSESVPSTGKTDGPDLGYDPQLLKRANVLFPAVSQNRQRLAWLQAQEQKGTENTINSRKVDTTLAAIANRETIAKMNNDTKKDVQNTKSGAYRDVNAEKTAAFRERTASNQDIARINNAARSSDRRLQNAASLLRANITAGQMYDPKGVADPSVQAAAKLLGVDLSGGGQQASQEEPQAPRQQAPRPLSAQDQQAINWANSNPADPRAAEIKKRLGVK